MARSLWRGKTFIKDFIIPTYNIDLKDQFKLKRASSNAPIKLDFMLSDDIKIYRRNHVALVSQQAVLQRLLPIYMYNGYDFVSLNALTNLELSTDLTLKLNLAERVTTRESNVVHKAKLSKAARKNKAQLVKKKSLSLSKKGAAKTPVVSRKGLITKKLRK